MTAVLNPQDALIAAMLLMSAADRDISDNELREIGATVDLLPAFKGYDRDRIGNVSSAVVDLLQDESGLDALISLIDQATPDRMKETVYAIACDVAAADGAIQVEEARLLELLAAKLNVERLIAAGIERGARARHTPMP